MLGVSAVLLVLNGVSWSDDLCAKVLDDRMFDAGSKKAGSGSTKALCRIDLWQFEVDE